jgi:YgiT-type zinc finger domain-containing protein
MMSVKPEVCPLCGGRKASGTTTFTADFGSGVVVVRNVRATVCSQCGEEWINNETASELEQIVNTAKLKGMQFEVQPGEASIREKHGTALMNELFVQAVE